MADKVIVTKSKMTSLANAIRVKSGSTANLTVDEMTTTVSNITVPSGTKTIVENGTGIDVGSYKYVDVNVSGGGGQNCGIYVGMEAPTDTSAIWLKATPKENVKIVEEFCQGFYDSDTYYDQISSTGDYIVRIHKSSSENDYTLDLYKTKYFPNNILYSTSLNSANFLNQILVNEKYIVLNFYSSVKIIIMATNEIITLSNTWVSDSFKQTCFLSGDFIYKTQRYAPYYKKYDIINQTWSNITNGTEVPQANLVYCSDNKIIIASTIYTKNNDEWTSKTLSFPKTSFTGSSYTNEIYYVGDNKLHYVRKYSYNKSTFYYNNNLILEYDLEGNFLGLVGTQHGTYNAISKLINNTYYSSANYQSSLYIIKDNSLKNPNKYAIGSFPYFENNTNIIMKNLLGEYYSLDGDVYCYNGTQWSKSLPYLKLESVNINNQEVELGNANKTIEYTLTPLNCGLYYGSIAPSVNDADTYKNFIMKPANETIATLIGNTGAITPVAYGTTDVKCSFIDNLGTRIDKTIQLKVVPAKVTNVEIYNLYVDFSKDYDIDYSYSPTYIITKSIDISSDNTDVLTIVDGKLHAVATGTANLTISITDDGDRTLSATKQINVVNELPYKYNVENQSQDTYGFTLNSNNYYESTNKGIHSSYAMTKIILNSEIKYNLFLDCISSGESAYDFGILSELDKELSHNYTADTTNVKKSFKGIPSTEVQTVEYGEIEPGKHYIYAKFIKDGSSSSGNDSLQFQVRMEPVE